MEPRDSQCPFLFPLLADQLCVYPVSAFCRPPGGGVRVPAAGTLARLCVREYTECARYRASAVPAEGAIG